MKTWFAVLSVAALLCGSVACNRHNETADRQAHRDLGTPGTGTAGAGTAAPDTYGRTNGGDVGADAGTGTGTSPGAQQGQRTLTGKLMVKDQTARTFQIDDNGATYVAPSQTNLGQLDGQEVTVQIDENGRVQNIQPSTASDREG